VSKVSLRDEMTDLIHAQTAVWQIILTRLEALLK